MEHLLFIYSSYAAAVGRSCSGGEMISLGWGQPPLIVCPCSYLESYPSHGRGAVGPEKRVGSGASNFFGWLVSGSN